MSGPSPDKFEIDVALAESTLELFGLGGAPSMSADMVKQAAILVGIHAEQMAESAGIPITGVVGGSLDADWSQAPAGAWALYDEACRASEDVANCPVTDLPGGNSHVIAPDNGPELIVLGVVAVVYIFAIVAAAYVASTTVKEWIVVSAQKQTALHQIDENIKLAKAYMAAGKPVPPELFGALTPRTPTGAKSGSGPNGEDGKTDYILYGMGGAFVLLAGFLLLESRK